MAVAAVVLALGEGIVFLWAILQLQRRIELLESSVERIERNRIHRDTNRRL